MEDRYFARSSQSTTKIQFPPLPEEIYTHGSHFPEEWPHYLTIKSFWVESVKLLLNPMQLSL